MKKIFFLVSDIGTSGIKTGVIDSYGKILYITIREYKTVIKNGVFVEQTPETWWNAYLDSMNEVFDKIKISPKQIATISISGHTPSVIAVDKNGNSLRNAIIWMDSRSTEQCEQLIKNKKDLDVESISVNKINPTYTLPKLMWLKDNENHIFKKTYKFLQTNGYLIYKLTGRYSIDITNCNLTQLYDLNKNKWSEEICESIGLDINKLPQIFNSYEIVGNISKKCSEITGLGNDTPVIAGCNDTAASSLGVGVIKHGDSFMVMGQAGGIGYCSNILPSNSIFMNYNYIFPNSWFVLAPMAAFAASYKWARENLWCFINAASRSENPYKIMDGYVQDEKPGADNIIFLPYMAGERAPIWDSNAKGVLFGLSLSSNMGKILRAIMEGTSFAVRHNLEVIESNGIMINDLICTGGGSRSKIWCRILADITNKNVKVTDISEDVLMGNAILAGIGTGIYKKENISGILAGIISTEAIYHPDDKNKDLYSESFNLYKKLYMHLKEDFKIN